MAPSYLGYAFSTAADGTRSRDDAKDVFRGVCEPR
jgi:hypothetical protein